MSNFYRNNFPGMPPRPNQPNFPPQQGMPPPGMGHPNMQRMTRTPLIANPPPVQLPNQVIAQANKAQPKPQAAPKPNPKNIGLDQNIEKSQRSVFVGNIPYETTDEMLIEVFKQAGNVLSFRMVHDRETGKPKGYGFAEYADVETAQSAIRNLNNHDFRGRQLRVGSAAAGDLSVVDPTTTAAKEEESKYGPTVETGKAPEAISKAVASLPPEQMFALMKQMKVCIQNNPNEARNILLKNPQLAYGLLQAQIVMKIVDPQVAVAMLHRQLDQVPPLELTEGDNTNTDISSLMRLPDEDELRPDPQHDSSLMNSAPGGPAKPHAVGVVGDPHAGAFSGYDVDHRVNPAGTPQHPPPQQPPPHMGAAAMAGGNQPGMGVGVGGGAGRVGAAAGPGNMHPADNNQHKSQAQLDSERRTELDRRMERERRLDQDRISRHHPGAGVAPAAGAGAMAGVAGHVERSLDHGGQAGREVNMPAGPGASSSSATPGTAAAAAAAPTAGDEQRSQAAGGSGNLLNANGEVPDNRERAQLVMQVLQLSESQIAMLPPDQRKSIMLLKAKISNTY